MSDATPIGRVIVRDAADWLWATAIAVVAVVAMEVARVPWAAWPTVDRAGAVLALAGQVAAATLAFAAPWLALAVGLSSWHRLRPADARAMTLARGTGLTVLLHAVFAAHPPFRGAPPIVAMCALAGIGHALALHALHRRTSPAVVGVGAALAGAIVASADAALLAGRYPELHRGLGLAAGLAWVTAGAALLRVRPRAARRLGGLAAALLLVTVAGGALLPRRDDLGDALASTAFATAPTPATTRAASTPTTPACELPTRTAEETAAAFAAATALPPLPDGFRLDDHDVLLILIDTVRYDDTSLAPGGPATTPHLAALAADDAITLHRAIAPSSGTLQTLAALLTLAPTSQAGLQIEAARPSRGAVRPDAPQVAEAFAAAGYDRFVSAHVAVGLTPSLTAGFVTVETHPGGSQPTTDAAIVDTALRRLTERRAPRTFGLLFLESPHDPYRERAGWPTDPRGRYRGEIAYADAQLGRLIDALDASGALSTTVVIVAADHGEEFGEHGRRHHAQSVTPQVTRVPAVVRVPGGRRNAVIAPVSLGDVLPWLMLTGSPPLASAATHALASRLLPARAAAGGAVISELLARNTTMSTALVFPRATARIDLGTGRLRFFDTARDPLELRARADEPLPLPAPIGPTPSPDDASDYALRAAAAGYLAWRACAANVTFSDTPLTPP